MNRKLLLLIDLNGTLHVGDVPISNTVNALKLLRLNADKFCVKFVTNTTKESVSSLHSRLLRCGFDDIKHSEIFSSLSAARKLIVKQNLRPLFFLESDALRDFEGIPTNKPNSVVVGLAPSKFNFEDLNVAFKILLNSDSKLIAINKSRYFKSDSEKLSLGAGPFVECLQFATGKVAKVVGKPNLEFFHQAIEFANESFNETFEPQDSIMIGDDVRDDVIGAINAGMNAILVRSGKYRTGDENKITLEKRNCVGDFAEAVQFLLSKYSS